MNDDNIRNREMQDDRNNIDPTDCMILNGLLKNLKTLNTLSEVKLFSQLFLLSSSANPANDDLIAELCLCINMVDDVPLLEYKPHFSVYFVFY